MGCVYRHKGRRTYWIKYKSAGKFQYETSGSTREGDAKRLLRLREGDTAKGIPVTSQIGRMKFADAKKDLLDYHAARRRSIKKMTRRIVMHLEPVFGELKMTDITVAHAESYRARRVEQGASTATINRELGLLKQMFSLAVRAGKLMAKPHIELPAEDNARQGFFEREAFESVIPKLPDDLRPLVTTMYYTGWRAKSELLPLQWKHVDRTHQQLRLEPGTTKNKQGRTFPYGAIPELRDAIETQWREHERLKKQGNLVPWVFHRDGLRIRSFLKAFKTACKAAGLPGRIPHDMRRTAVRNLERAGVPRSVAMALVGHKTEAMYRRYAIASEADLQVAGERLGALFTSVFTSSAKQA